MYAYTVSPLDRREATVMSLNSTSSHVLDLLMGNSSSSLAGGAVITSKDSFTNALTKNIVAMLVWLALSVVNGSMVHTFLRHRYTPTHKGTQGCVLNQSLVH